MSNPGLSLFNNGMSLQLDAVNQQEREEEEEEAEEQRRIEAELAEKLEGAFDDLDLDEGDESSIYSPPNTHQGLLTPGEAPMKYVTSTPFSINNFKDFQMTEENRFHPLAVEETTFEGGAEEDYPPPTVAAYHDGYLPPTGGYTHQINGAVKEGGDKTLTNELGKFRENVPAGISPVYNSEEPPGGRYSRTVQFPDQLNKSDTEKVRERGGGAGDKQADETDLMVLYTARGREIERLESELERVKSEHVVQLRTLRTHLASRAMEKQQQNSSCGQLEQLLADSRRENKLLKEDVHVLKQHLQSLAQEKEQLEMEHEGDKEAVTQLQLKLRELQGSDVVLKARQQHDAVVRSMKERHENELQRLRTELDAANSTTKSLKTELSNLREKFENLQNNHDYVVREKTSQIDEISLKYAELQRRNTELLSRDQTSEINRLGSSLRTCQEQNQELEQQIRSYKSQLNSLQIEVAGYEAITVDDPSDSILALGLSGSHKQDGSIRLKEELHRSLNGNKTKREEIARLEVELGKKSTDLNRLRTEVDRLKAQLAEAEKIVSMRAENEVELADLRREVEQLRPRNVKLERNLAEAEQQNIQVKKCMTEMLEGNNEDKMEAIDSLREEYEEHCRNAVQQTKSLMEGEVRRLKIELDVYSKTVTELRKKLDTVSKMSDDKPRTSDDGGLKTAALNAKIVDLEGQLTLASREKAELEEKIGELERRLVVSLQLPEQQELEAALRDKMEAEFEERLEKTRADLREIWNKNKKGDLEEAVAAARLDWLKRLPELEKEGGAARESVGQLQLLQDKLSAVTKEMEKRSLQLSLEKERKEERELELNKIRSELEGLRRGRGEEEERLREELRTTLTRQQEQWQGILSAARQENELQRQQINQRYEEEVRMLETRVKKKEEERINVENKLDQVETEYGLALEKWKRVLEDKNKTIENLKRSDGDLELLKAELERRVEEAEAQRAEMSSMAERWGQEVRSIQESHNKERKELDEVTEKYKCLKSKVRKYQRHVETKENHYKQEYSRLEQEFKCTLERLRERMEQAYSAKEREVEQELGNMRNQFTQELRNIAERRAVPDKQDFIFEDESLKKFYLETNKEIKQLLK